MGKPAHKSEKRTSRSAECAAVRSGLLKAAGMRKIFGILFYCFSFSRDESLAEEQRIKYVVDSDLRFVRGILRS